LLFLFFSTNNILVDLML